MTRLDDLALKSEEDQVLGVGRRHHTSGFFYHTAANTKTCLWFPISAPLLVDCHLWRLDIGEKQVQDTVHIDQQSTLRSRSPADASP